MAAAARRALPGDYLRPAVIGPVGTSPGSHTLSQFAQDTAALLRHLGIARAAIWGESAGVAIAATFALEFPELTSALIIGDGAPWFCTDAEVV